jgi:hypothetical protein
MLSLLLVLLLQPHSSHGLIRMHRHSLPSEKTATFDEHTEESEDKAAVLETIQSLKMKLKGSTKDAVEKSLSLNLTVNGHQWSLLHKKLRSKKKIRIGVVGGSTSAGGANPHGGLKPTDPLWFMIFATWLEKTFGVKTEVFNAAVGGSTTLASFWGLDTKLPPNLDLVFWEHAHNDHESMVYFQVNRLGMSYWVKNKNRIGGSWLLSFLQKVSVAHPEAPVAMLYSWMATVDYEAEKIWGAETSKDYAFPQHENVLKLFSPYHDVAWASNELFREQTTEVPASASKNEHFDAFGHALTGNLMCYLLLANLRQSSSTSGTTTSGGQRSGVRAMSIPLQERVAEAGNELGPAVKRGITHRWVLWIAGINPLLIIIY